MDRNETIDALKHCAGTGMGACRGCPNKDADWAAAGYVGCREFSEDNATVPVALIRRTIELLQLQAPADDDMISRSALLAAYDAAHKGPPGGARKLIEEAPCIGCTL